MKVKEAEQRQRESSPLLVEEAIKWSMGPLQFSCDSLSDGRWGRKGVESRVVYPGTSKTSECLAL